MSKATATVWSNDGKTWNVGLDEGRHNVTGVALEQAQQIGEALRLAYDFGHNDGIGDSVNAVQALKPDGYQYAYIYSQPSEAR